MYLIAKYLLAVAVLSMPCIALSFFDDFNDDDISDWENRIGGGTWSASSGMVHGSISGSPGVLAPISSYFLQDVTVSTSCTGAHAFGVTARLTDDDSGVIAYVSPDHDLARIRLVINGQLGPDLSTIYYDFPSGVFYNLTFTCQNDELDFLIEVPSTSQSWSFSATDPDPEAGSFGLLMGSEPGASWDWIEVEGIAEGLLTLTWFTTDDSAVGDGNFCLEPGETIQLSMELTNSSDYTVENAFGILQSMNPELQITQNYLEYGDIQAMSSSYGNGSFAVMAPLITPLDEVYDMRLTVMADGGYQDQIYFSLPVGCGLDTDLEGDPFGWTWDAAAEGWENDWHVSSSRNHTPGGQYSFKCGSTGSGDYSDHHYGYIESPYFNIPLQGECRFWSWLEAQVQSSSIALDGGIVQYRRLDEWSDLFPVPAYSYQIASGSTGPFADGTSVYSGTVGWTEYSMIFPEDLAGPGAIRFLFGTDDAGNREGWYIDDFLVYEPGAVSESYSGPLLQPFLSVSENPFSEAVLFSCSVPGTSIEIRDISGRLVGELDVSGQAGSVIWNTSGLASGIYFAGIAGSDAEPLKLVKF